MSEAAKSNHFDEQGQARMVDVSSKATTVRTALAVCDVRMAEETVNIIRAGKAKKGDVLGVARLAAIQATKLTPMMIPLCHAIPVEGVRVDFSFVSDQVVRCEAEVRTSGKTGVEMEALSAVMVAGLTIYDMCKSVDRAMEIGPARLLRKTGGASGSFARDGSFASGGSFASDGAETSELSPEQRRNGDESSG